MREIPEQPARWVLEGMEKGARWLIVACDTFDFEDYPVFVMPDQDLEKVRAEHDGKNMQRIHQVIRIPAAP